MTPYQLSLYLEIPAEALRAAPANPFLDARVPTLADMIEAVKRDSTLAAHRRYELVSALRGFAKLMHQEPAAMAAVASHYRRQVSRLVPAGCGLSAKRIANIKSDMTFCLNRYGMLKRRTVMPPVGPAWQPLWRGLKRFQILQLSRFVRWCSASGRIPAGITDDDIEQFHKDVSETFANNPNKLTQTICRTWNEVRDNEPDLGLPPLTVPKYHQPYCLPESALPQSFQRELDAFCRRLAVDDLFAEDAPPRPLRPETIRLRRFHVRQLASGLVRMGAPADAIGSLATLVSPDNLSTSLRFFIDRAGGRTTAQIAGLAGTAKLIAKHWVHVGPETLDRVGRIVGKVRFNQVGMTKKNRDRLRQFDEDPNLQRILGFAAECFVELRDTDDGDIPAARLAEVAIAVELLLAAPIRVGNLAALHLKVHIQRSRTTEQSVWYLWIPAEETKNHKTIECVLGPRLVAILREYLTHYRPRLAQPGNDYLFPSGADHIRSSTLGKMLSAKLRSRTGLDVNPHLFRHLAGNLILEDTPGNYGLVQTVLGHRSAKTTLNHYAGEETAAAFHHFDSVVSRVRERLESRGRKP